MYSAVAVVYETIVLLQVRRGAMCTHTHARTHARREANARHSHKQTLPFKVPSRLGWNLFRET